MGNAVSSCPVDANDRFSGHVYVWVHVQFTCINLCRSKNLGSQDKC